MSEKVNIRNIRRFDFPQILPVKEQSSLITQLVMDRLDTILPLAMKEANLDMWIILCQEDDLDPVYNTMIPMDCWCPFLQMLIFVDEGDDKIKRYSVSRTDTKDLYERPYIGYLDEKKWSILLDLVSKRDPKNIGVNIGNVKWCGGGLTYNLCQQLKERLPRKYSERIVSAEKTAARWGATLTNREIDLFQHVIKISHYIIADCFSRKTITPGVSTVDDLVWFYRQWVSDLGLDVSFRPYFNIIRDGVEVTLSGKGNNIILPGDIIHCDVGLKYLRLNSDNQYLAYILRRGETDAPAGLKSLMAQTNQLQDIFMDEFRRGISGNELHQNILKRAQKEGISNPKVYSHSLGLFLHQPGPLIGLLFDQENPLPRGEMLMEYNYAFAMELSTEGPVREWDNNNFWCRMEEPVIFTKEGCHTLNDRQTEFYLI